VASIGRSRIEELYGRFTDGFLAQLRSDDFYQYFLNSMRAGEKNVSLYERFIERNVDFRWVEMIENTIILRFFADDNFGNILRMVTG